MLLHATHAGDFGQAAPPDTLQAWLDGRAERAANETPKTDGDAPGSGAGPDPAAQAKRRAPATGRSRTAWTPCRPSCRT